MIKIINLTKIYKQEKTEFKALNSVSFTLPSKGMIFITGKSGSGKTTLLNCLSCLDNITDGQILIGNKDITKFKESELNEYHNSFAGIVYQAYNLFENETVLNNILYSSVLCEDDKSEEEIDEILRSVDLLEKKNELVKNLSGGQKQRCSIARCLVKSPNVIYADEPTGNLDSNNSELIFDLFKKLSKDHLIVIVSHDLVSAEKYGDRIITLKDGQIESDVIRNDEYVDDEKGVLYIEDEISEDIKENINKDLEKYDLKIKKKKSKFIPNNLIDEDCSIELNQSKNKNFKKSGLLLSKLFLKSSIKKFVGTGIISGILVSLLALAYEFSNFNPNNAALEFKSNYGVASSVFFKEYSEDGEFDNRTSTYENEVEEDDINAFVEDGYKGKVYPIYNLNVDAKKGQNLLAKSLRFSTNTALSYFYSKLTFGTVIGDDSLMTTLFGDNPEFIKGSYDECKNDSTKLIITDFFADSILYWDIADKEFGFVSPNPEDPYRKIYNKEIYGNYTVGAIVKTGYSEKYDKLQREFIDLATSTINVEAARKKLIKSNDFIMFANDCESRLNYAYSLNQNLKQDYIESNPMVNSYVQILQVCNNDQLINTLDSSYLFSKDTSINKGEIKLSTQFYNTIKDVLSVDSDGNTYLTFKNHKHYSNIDFNNPYSEVKLKILPTTKKATNSKYIGYINEEDFKIFQDVMIHTQGLMFDDVSNVFGLYNTGKRLIFNCNVSSLRNTFDMGEFIGVFSTIFQFFAILLIIVAAVILMNSTFRLVKRNSYKIGVLKSLGHNNRIISLSFINTAIVLLFIFFVASHIFSIGFTYLGDFLIGTGFAEYFKTPLLVNVTFVKYSFVTVLIFTLVICAISLLTIFYPLSRIRKIKANILINQSKL